jgi:hypothetical protein
MLVKVYSLTSKKTKKAVISYHRFLLGVSSPIFVYCIKHPPAAEVSIEIKKIKIRCRNVFFAGKP